ncbi:hypothetical protein B0H10DRAFT_1938003 [Mycena sp. CBHHK59/15]|nr:hypothetical protein B0H10DRAFT_1938003 [Mycena sp. CBHHK59/15]
MGKKAEKKKHKKKHKPKEPKEHHVKYYIVTQEPDGALVCTCPEFAAMGKTCAEICAARLQLEFGPATPYLRAEILLAVMMKLTMIQTVNQLRKNPKQVIPLPLGPQFSEKPGPKGKGFNSLLPPLHSAKKLKSPTKKKSKPPAVPSSKAPQNGPTSNGSRKQENPPQKDNKDKGKKKVVAVQPSALNTEALDILDIDFKRWDSPNYKLRSACIFRRNRLQEWLHSQQMTLDKTMVFHYDPVWDHW